MLQLLPSRVLRRPVRRTARALAALSIALAPALAQAQDRLKTMPGYEQFQRVAPQINSSVKSGALNVNWSPDGKSFEYFFDGTRQRFDLATKKRHRGRRLGTFGIYGAVDGGDDAGERWRSWHG